MWLALFTLYNMRKLWILFLNIFLWILTRCLTYLKIISTTELWYITRPLLFPFFLINVKLMNYIFFQKIIIWTGLATGLTQYISSNIKMNLLMFLIPLPWHLLHQTQMRSLRSEMEGGIGRDVEMGTVFSFHHRCQLLGHVMKLEADRDQKDRGRKRHCVK